MGSAGAGSAGGDKSQACRGCATQWSRASVEYDPQPGKGCEQDMRTRQVVVADGVGGARRSQVFLQRWGCYATL